MDKSAEMVLACQTPLVILPRILGEVNEVNLNPASVFVANDGFQRRFGLQLLL